MPSLKIVTKSDEPERARENRAEELRLLEAMLFASSEPLDEKSLAAQLPQGVDVHARLVDLQQEYAPRGVNLVRVEGKWSFRTANDLAWLLCTQTDGQYRNGLQALRLAKRAVELTGSKSPGTLDTLAAANADLGQFDQAIATAQQAAEAASAAGQKELAAHIQSRLQLYRSEQPYRE